MTSGPPPPGHAGRFATTHWSQVLAAGRGGSPGSRQALEALCEAYWYPLYAFVRRSGHPPEDARDLTQAFFARLLEKDYLQAADPERGRFRSFLLAAFKHFLSQERDRATAQKRGGGRPVLSLDFAAGEDRYRLEPAHHLTPERVYERRWALMLLDRVLQHLREEFTRSGKAELFDRLGVFLTGEDGVPAYRQVAQECGLSEGAVKVAVHRLRRRFRDALLAEIAQTVADPADAGAELRGLFDALRADHS
jgi:RNA polymerase sigma-70 factor (ECF subfamily)